MIRRAALLAALTVAAMGLPAEARAYSLSAECSFFGTPNGGSFQIVLAGHAEATSQLETRVAMYTQVTCKVTNVPAGGSNTLVSTNGFGTGVAATAATQGGWPVLPITVCVSAFAIFGPLQPIQVTKNEVCVSP